MLIEALDWIRKFRDKVTVIKLGGSVLDNADALRHLLLDIVFMETVGMRPVVVHGGGAAINRAMTPPDSPLDSSRAVAIPMTPPSTSSRHVLAYETNQHRPTGSRSSVDVGTAKFSHESTCCSASGSRCRGIGRPADRFGLGRKRHASGSRDDRQPLLCRHRAGDSVDVSTKPGEKLNVNADTAATAMAQALGRRKAGFLSDVNGVRRSKDDPGSLDRFAHGRTGTRDDC